MNMLQRFVQRLTQPKVEDMVLNFVADKLRTEHAHVLVTDTAMHPVYTRLATGLCSAFTGELVPIESSIDAINGHEAILAHSSFNEYLLRAVAQRSSHIILIVEYFDTTALYQEKLADIQRETGCEIDFAFIEEGQGPKKSYSPTEAHYLKLMIRRILKWKST